MKKHDFGTRKSMRK